MPVESVAVTVIVWVPAGVPGELAPDVLLPVEDALDPPHPGREIKLQVRSTMGTKYIRRR